MWDTMKDRRITEYTSQDSRSLDINRDMKFDEDTAYNKSRKKPTEDPEEPESPMIQDTSMNDTNSRRRSRNRRTLGTCGSTQEKNTHKRKPAWVREAIQGAERYGAAKEVHRERKRTRSCSGYVALLCDFIDKEPSNYEEATNKKEWKDDMIKEYQ